MRLMVDRVGLWCVGQGDRAEYIWRQRQQRTLGAASLGAELPEGQRGSNGVATCCRGVDLQGCGRTARPPSLLNHF